MRRRTINRRDRIDRVIREDQREGESFSAAVARLIDEGARAHGRIPKYVGSGVGPSDLSLLAEEYLRESARSAQ
jgi:hypothetical protein